MKKKIVIDATDTAEIKKVEKNIYKTNYCHFIDNHFIEWLIYMIGYAVVLIIVSKMFPSFELNISHFGIYALLASIIIYLLNQTIKPILKIITLPLTILSYGLLYPLSNIIILYLTSFLLGNNFNLNNFLSAFVIAIFISIFNMLIEGLIIKPIINRKRGHYE